MRNISSWQPNGMVKKTPMKEYSNVRKNGLQAIVLRDDDELIGKLRLPIIPKIFS